MNHPSEWTKYYDAPRGYFRYKHKGTGVVRDTLMNIGKRFKKPSAKKERARQVLQKIMEDETKQILKTAADKAVTKTVDPTPLPGKKRLTRYKLFYEAGIPQQVKPKSKKTAGVNPTPQ